MHIVIVIVGFRNFEDVNRCLGALNESTYHNFEIMICENGGTDAFNELSRKLPNTLENGQKITNFQAPSNLGYAGGINLVLRNSQSADAWWILNPDTVAEPETLSKLIQRLKRGDCHLVGGVQCSSDQKVESDGGKWRPWLARAVSLGRGRDMVELGNSELVESQLNFISGASMLVSRDFLSRVGMMREDYFLYCEEVEWCLRGKKLGMRFGYSPEAKVLHYQGSATGSGQSVNTRPKLPIYMDERNKILVTRDCYRYRLPVVAIAALLLLVGRYLRRGAVKQFFYGVQGWKDGLLNRRGIPEWLNN